MSEHKITGKYANEKIYLASSWRNTSYPHVLKLLRAAGHDVYDFRQPDGADHGFSWDEIDTEWKHWTPDEYRHQLIAAPAAARGYDLDMTALDACGTCVLLLPCGRSSHLEAGYAVGAGKRLIIYLSADEFQPELMYQMADRLVVSDYELLEAIRRW